MKKIIICNEDTPKAFGVMFTDEMIYMSIQYMKNGSIRVMHASSILSYKHFNQYLQDANAVHIITAWEIEKLIIERYDHFLKKAKIQAEITKEWVKEWKRRLNYTT